MRAYLPARNEQSLPMSTRRKFAFPLSALTKPAQDLLSALNDPKYSAAMQARLGVSITSDLNNRLSTVTVSTGSQSAAAGEIGELTDEQLADFREVERLVAGARRSARLAFPSNATRLHDEFQVGIETPKTLAAELQRAEIVRDSCVRHATALAAKGWIAQDATDLAAAIAALTTTGSEHSEKKDDKLDLTNNKTAAANALYDECLRVQNAARLQYPDKTDSAGNKINATARARFLLDEFPPRDRSQPDGGTQGGTTPPPTPSTP